MSTPSPTAAEQIAAQGQAEVIMDRMEERRLKALERARTHVLADPDSHILHTDERVRLEVHVAEFLYGERGRFANSQNGPVTSAARLQHLAGMAGKATGPAGGSTQSV